jgi:hypothetical protein
MFRKVLSGDKNATNSGPIFSLILVLLILSASISLNCCKRTSASNEIRQADTLIKWVNEASETMVIDPEAIRLRTDSMKIKLTLIKKDTQYKHMDELRYSIKEYEGIFTTYMDFLEKYSNLEFDNLQYSKQATTLKNDLIDRKLSPAEFSKSYPETRKKIKDHLDQTKTAIRTIASIEEMYGRLDHTITEYYHMVLKKENHK